MNEVVFWGAPDEERLTHEDMDEAIEAILEQELGELTGTLTICGYARMQPEYMNLMPLEHCLEELDEEYGDLDGDYSAPTPAMVAAEKAFLAVIASEYIPWACEEVERREIDVAAWVCVHRPDWIDEEASK